MKVNGMELNKYDYVILGLCGVLLAWGVGMLVYEVLK